MRGGTGDEVPIQLLASRGYSVLSIQKPEALPETLSATDLDALQRTNVTDWAERRRLFRSLDAGIDAAVAAGIADPDKIGIAGFSDGGGTVQFALNNSTRFGAAAIGTCCDEPGMMFVGGPSYAASGARWGYPPAGADGRQFWKPQSLSLNAERMRVPLLLQLADSEVRGAAEPFAALKAQGAPVDMYVFAGERHLKTRPAHRLAVYLRNADWFDFWLRGVESNIPARQAELVRWRAMRSRLEE
jgi:dipeptidyl aminopeptidase/acylaminoacyl peptidase